MALVSVQGLRKEYGSLIAVNDVSFAVEEGQVVGLIGPNGAGKTTLLKMLATLLPPSAGRASILGHDLADSFLEIRRSLGYMPDFFNLYDDLTLYECLWFFARAYGIEPARIQPLVAETLRYIQLEEKQNDRVKNLSRGMVQRLGVGVLLVHEPRLLLLDEPASGLDPKARIQLREVLKRLSREGRTIIISSHILTELSGFCSHIALMDRGRLKLYGSVEEIERAVGGKRRIRVRALDRVAELAAYLDTLPDVTPAGTDTDAVLFETDVSLDALADLHAGIVREGFKIVEFSEQRTDLEGLFMKIAGDSPLPVPIEKGNDDAG